MADEMTSQWDPFLDAYAALKEKNIAYETLLKEAIESLAKTKKQDIKEKYKVLKEGKNNGES